MRRGDAFGVIAGAVAYGVAHAGWLPALVYWPLTEGWSWSWGGAGGVSMRYFGLLLWAGAGYGVGALAATLWRPRSEGSGRGGAAASASEGQSMGAFYVVAAVMLYLLVAEVWFGH